MITNLTRCLALLIRPLCVKLVSWIYRPRLIDSTNVPSRQGAILVSNHTSFLDPLLISGACRRPVRFVYPCNGTLGVLGTPENQTPTKISLTQHFLNALLYGSKGIAYQWGNHESMTQMTAQVQAALQAGNVVTIFPEVGLTRTEQINPFRSEFFPIFSFAASTDQTNPSTDQSAHSFLNGAGSSTDQNANLTILPVFIGGFWGSLFSMARPRGSRRRPTRLLRRPTLAFGKPVERPASMNFLHQIVEELGVDAMKPGRFPQDRQLYSLARQVLRNNRRFAKKPRISDSTGVHLTGGQTILRILVVRRVLKHILDPEEKMVGLLMPTSVGGVLLNAGLVFDGRVPINLNYTFSNETNNYCIQKVGIKHVITTKRLLQKLPNLRLDVPVILIEDVLAQVTSADKIVGLLESFLPTWILERWLGLTKKPIDDLNTIIFTSGATGQPKGVMLTESNITSNILAFMQQLNFSIKDVHLGVLPLFHSFGYTTSTWAVLTLPVRCFYHVNPLDSKLIGEFAEREKVTVLTMTPTFARNYLRRCPTEKFAHVHTAIPGAEKLSPDLLLAWKEKYGQPLSEGFGMTELSPVLSVNIPAARAMDTEFPYAREGSIGRPDAGFAVRILDLDTGKILPPNQQGMLEVKGPSVMKGYYNEPEKTADSFHGEWLVTGDIARIDEDGFIFITGRLTRMAKIGGEMVPLVHIEEKIGTILAQREKELLPEADSAASPSAASPSATSLSEASSSATSSSATSSSATSSSAAANSSKLPNDDAAIRFAVTSVPDEKKGEKVVVVYTSLLMTPEEICDRLLAMGLPQIWVPSPAHFRQVDSIPILGSGKLDLKGIKQLAEDLYAV